MSSFWPTAGAGTFSSGETSFSHLQITQTIYAPHISAKSAGQPYRGLGLKVKAIADNSVRSDLSSSERSVLRNFGSSSAKVNALAVDLDERIIAKSLTDDERIPHGRIVGYASTWLPTSAQLWNSLLSVGGYTDRWWFAQECARSSQLNE
jgi:hypothetical protein